MFSSDLLKNPGSFLASIKSLQKQQTDLMTTTQTLLSGQTYFSNLVTGADGTITVDYTSLALTKPPGIVVMTRLAKADQPVTVDIMGDPTSKTAVLRVRRQSSVVGLLPSFVAVAGVKLDVFIRPQA